MVQINFELLPMKLHYFLWNAGTAPIVPFIPTLAKQLGFSTVIVGTIYTFLPIFGLLAKPIFGALSDRFKIQKTLLVSFIVVTASFFYCILYIPPIEEQNKVQLDCGEGETSFQHCVDDKTSNSCNWQKFTKNIADLENVVYQCKLNCKTQDQKFLNSLCQHWKVSKFCSHTVQDVNVHNNVHTDALNISKRFDPTLHGKYNIHEKGVGIGGSYSVDASSTTEFSFISHVSAYHILKIKNCLYFPISHVHFNFEDAITEHIPVCKTPIDVKNCTVSCNNAEIMLLLSTNTESSLGDVAVRYQFWFFFLFLILSWIGMAVVVSLGDTICFELLGNEPHKYGKQRLWGSIGWGIFSIIAGFLVDHFSSGPNKNYVPVFYLMLAILLFDLFVSTKIKNVQTSVTPNIFKDVSKLLQEPRVAAFLFWCISSGICTAMIWQYLFWFLEDLGSFQGCDFTKWMKTLQGLSMTTQCLGGELPFFFLSGWFLRKVGHVNCMSLVLLAFAVRFYLYSILTNPWYSVPVELFSGPTFGLLWPCMASYANHIAPPGTEATIQGLVGSVFEGIGVSLGSLVGGMVYQSVGGVMTFRIYSIVAVLFCIIHNVTHYLLKAKAQYGMEDNVKVVGQRTRYATPTEAMHMLEYVAS